MTLNHMVYSDSEISLLFAAVADPTRRSILEALRAGERAIGELAEPFDMTLPAVSKHVHVLERAGLLDVRRAGRVRVCRLRAGSLRAGQAWIARFEEFWTAELDQVDRYLSAEMAPPPAPPPDK